MKKKEKEIKTIVEGRYTYKINEKKGVVMCHYTKNFNGDTYEGRGLSRCNMDTDTFNEEIGKKLAKLRAITECYKKMYNLEFVGCCNEGYYQRQINYWTYLLNMKHYLEKQIPQLKKDIKQITDNL